MIIEEDVRLRRRDLQAGTTSTVTNRGSELVSSSYFTPAGLIVVGGSPTQIPIFGLLGNGFLLLGIGATGALAARSRRARLLLRRGPLTP